MHGYHRRRSPLKVAVWCGAFLSLSFVLAWRFEWLPGSGEGESPVEPNSEVVGDAAPPDDATATADARNPFDRSVFERQQEPDGRDVNMPKNFTAPSSGVPKPGFLATASRKSKTTGPFDALRDDTHKRPPSETRFSRYGSSPDNRNRVAANNTPPRVPSRGTSTIRPAGFENTAADDSTPPADTLQKIDSLIRAGDMKAAHKELSQIYWKKPQWRKAIRQRIEQTAKAIFFDSKRHFMRPYVVQPGDQLRNIAKKYHLTYQYLERLNGVTARQIRPGMKLKVLNGPFSAVVDVKRRELTIHYHGYFVAQYPVGIGRDGKTPIGKHRIDDKLVNPTYTHTDERTGQQTKVAYGDPANPLGTRWLSIGRSFGIHGTNDQRSIGKAESAGCVRMHNADVEWVYDFLTVGSEVMIQK